MTEFGGRGGVHLEFPISSYFEVQQLSSQVRRKWETANVIFHEGSSKITEVPSNQQLTQALCNNGTPVSRHTPSYNEKIMQQRAQKLVDKLAEAEMKRQMKIEERKRKASHMLQKALLVAERLTERQSERAARLDAKLEQAEKARESHVAAAALKGSEAVAHAKAVSAAIRAKEESDGTRRRAELDLKLQRAIDARYEMTQTMLASLTLRQAEPFLVRRSLTRSILRRQSSSRVIQRCWRAFKAKKGTTRELARRFKFTGVPATGKSSFAESETSKTNESSSSTQPRQEEDTPASVSPPQAAAPSAIIGVNTTLLGMPEETPMKDPFEDFAAMLQSQATLRTATRFLHRLSLKSRLASTGAGTAGVGSLLKRLFPKVEKPDRYPARVFLCAYMILRHPKVVFNQSGEREASLGKAALEMEDAFGQLMDQLLNTPLSKSPRASMQWSPRSDPPQRRNPSKASSTSRLLHAFDSAWVQYLEQFVAWKSADAASLEAELVRVACEMETSMQKKLKRTVSGSPRPQSASDRQAMVEQVTRDHELLRERILRLGGQAGVVRLEAGLAAARAAAEQQASEVSPSSSPSRTPQGSPARPVSASWSPPSQPPAPAAAPVVAVTNETLAWELLYNMDYQLSSEEAEISWRDATGESSVMLESPHQVQGLPAEEAVKVTQTRVRRIAEAAFWDSLSETGPEKVASLLSELGGQLAEALPPRSRLIARVESQLNKATLLESISLGSAESLLPAFDLLAGLLLESGSEAREAPAVQAHAEIRAQLRASGHDSKAIIRQLVRALRLMAAQLRLLQIDMSNSTLRMLATSLAGREGIRYAQHKFADRMSIPRETGSPDLEQRLPHTRAWLAQASGLLAAMPASPPSASSISQTPSGVPAALRTGRGSISSLPTRTAQRQSAVSLVVGESANPHTWRGLVRIALVHLVCIEEPMNIGPSPMPETLYLDAGRIHAAKDAFQHLLVLSACLLISQQAALDRQVAPPQAEVLIVRLKSLMADHALGLESIVAELAQAVQPQGEAGPLQATLGAALKSMLSRNNPGFKALSGGLTKVLQQMILSNGMAPMEQHAALSRFGAAGLQAEVQKLAGKLAEIAAITEAVHEPIYSRFAEDLL